MPITREGKRAEHSKIQGVTSFHCSNFPRKYLDSVVMDSLENPR